MQRFCAVIPLVLAMLSLAGCPGQEIEPVETRKAVLSEELGLGLRVGMSTGGLPDGPVELAGQELQGPRSGGLQQENNQAHLWGSREVLLAVRSHREEVREVTVTVSEPGRTEVKTFPGLKVGRTLRPEVHRQLGDPDWSREQGELMADRWIQIDRSRGLVYQLTLHYRQVQLKEADEAEPGQQQGGAEGEDQQVSDGGAEDEEQSGSSSEGEENGADASQSDQSGQNLRPGWVLTSYGYARHDSVQAAEMYLDQAAGGSGAGEVTIPGEETREEWRERMEQESGAGEQP